MSFRRLVKRAGYKEYMYGEYLGDSAVAKQEIIAACNFSRGREK